MEKSLMSMAKQDIAKRGFSINAKNSGTHTVKKGSLGKRKESPVKSTKVKKRKLKGGK
jgi:hypothetical protein